MLISSCYSCYQRETNQTFVVFDSKITGQVIVKHLFYHYKICNYRLHLLYLLKDFFFNL